MKITPEIRSIQNAYMKAKNEQARAEMDQLKAKTMTLMNDSGSDEGLVKTPNSELSNISNVIINEDGDQLTISVSDTRRSKKLSSQFIKIVKAVVEKSTNIMDSKTIASIIKRQVLD